MANQQITDKYGTNYLLVNGDGSINTTATLTPPSDFAVEIKNATDDTRAKVKSDGTDNALCVYSNSLDVRNLAYATDSVTAHQGGTWDVVSNSLAIASQETLENVETSLTNIEGTILPNMQSSLTNIEIGGAKESTLGSIDGKINICDTNNLQATDLDIRDLDSGTDSVSAVQSGTWTIDTITNNVNVIASDLDIRDLTNASDSVEVFQATGTNLHMVVDSGTITEITNTVTVTASDLDIRDIDWSTDDIKVYNADECQRILTSDDAVTTVNYATSAKETVSNIVTSSATLNRKVTDTYDNSGGTTLVITRVVANA